MNGELILIRHGKAESKHIDKPDFERKLTTKGINEFTDFMSTVFPVLENKNSLKIWTSPLVRAKETAQILTTSLGIEAPEEKEFLATGNLDALLKDLKDVQNNFSVVCVGHEPFMSIWTEKLTGTVLYFPKGGLVKITFDGKSGETGNLDLKMSPKSSV